MQSAARIVPPPANYTFENGTTYVYKAEYRLWTAGHATLRWERDAATGEQHAIGAADTSGFVGLLFRVHDRFDAAVDPKTFCAQRLSKHIEEGSRKRDIKLQMDYPRRKSVLDDLNLKNGERKRSEYDIPECVSDVVSSLFYLGTLPLEPGATPVFPINDGGATVEVKVHVEGREQLQTDAGVFNTVRVQPESTVGLLKSKSRGVWIWYSDDARRIPVQMRGKMSWGTLTLRLERIDRAQPAAKP